MQYDESQHAADLKREPSRTGDAAAPSYAVATQAGVRKAEALRNRQIWGKKSMLFLFIGVAIMAYMYSLDGTSTWVYVPLATSDFKLHSLLGAVSTVSAIVIAVGKPIAAKFADVLGRTESWTIAILLYTVGYIVLAASNGIDSYAAGTVIRSAGYAAVQILMQIVIGDVTSLRWRTLVSSLVSAPYIVNAFVGANIAADIVRTSSWRWGYGMFAIVLPGGAIPLIGILLWSQVRAKKLGLVHTTNLYEEAETKVAAVNKSPILKQIAVFLDQMDFIGLLLFTAGWTLLLLPLNLANGLTLPWSSGKVIAMLVIGPVILIGFVFYEAKFARYPFIPARFVTNRTVLCAAMIGFFDFVSFYLQFTYQYSFIYVVKDWSLVNMNYFGQAQSVALTVFAIMAGGIVFYIRKYRSLLMIGLLIRLLGVGLMIRSKGARGTTAELVIVQLLQGAGGGFAAVLAQTAAQAAVAHQDLASVTAFVLIWAEIGNAIGTAICTAIWRNVMPGQLAQHLGGVTDQVTINGIFASITTAATYPFGSPIRNGTIEAYTYTMKVILIAATAVAIVPPVLVLFMKDIRFGDQQNDVERRAPDGESLHSEDSHDLDDKKVVV